MSNEMLPLERRLQEFSNSKCDSFPDRGANYWTRYKALVEYLKSEVYPYIDAGLACKSKSPGLYTEHGTDHFDEVVRYAGHLTEDEASIRPYELFLLLAAIRLHDAGNIEGREFHERRVFKILKDAGNAICSDDFEVDLIAKIAEAHGGTRDGSDDKDTISALPEEETFGAISFNPRAVAALVRFADEICEHSSRASSYHIRTDTLPPSNALFHYYAHSIKGANYDRSTKAFKLRIVFEAEFLKDTYPTPKHTAENPDMHYLIDDAMDRIDKLNTERLYCNRFIDPTLRTEVVEVSIEVAETTYVNGNPIRRTIKDWNFSLREFGYPDSDSSWRDNVESLRGAEIARKLNEGDSQL